MQVTLCFRGIIWWSVVWFHFIFVTQYYGMGEVRYGNWYCCNFIKTHFEHIHCFLKSVFLPLTLMKVHLAKWDFRPWSLSLWVVSVFLGLCN